MSNSDANEGPPDVGVALDRAPDEEASISTWLGLQGDAEQAVKAGDSEKAAGLFSAAADDAAENGALVDAVRLRCAAVDSLADAGDQVGARSSAHRSAVDLSDVSDSGEWVNLASSVNNALVATGLLDESVRITAELVLRADTLAVSAEEPDLLCARARSMYASALARVYRFDESLLALDEARALAPANAWDVIGNIEYTTGLNHAERNEIALARAAYSRARTAFTKGGDQFDIAYIDRMDGAALARTGRFEEAIEAFEQAKVTFSDLGLQGEVDRCEPGILQSRLQLGGTTWSDQQLDDLEKVAARMSPSESVAMGLNLANVSLTQHDLDRARRLGRYYITLADELGLEVNAAKLRAGMAVVLRHDGDVEGAMADNRAARGVFARSGLLRETANADVNYALLLEETATGIAGQDAATAMKLRDQAADSAISAVRVLDDLRHSLPRAADRHQMIRRLYPHVSTVAIGACFRSDRHDEVAALVERARTQPVLNEGADGYMEPRPVGTRVGAATISGSGEPVYLSVLAEEVQPGATWIGWWIDGDRLIRSRTSASETDNENGELDRASLDRLAFCQPVVLSADLVASDDDSQLATIVALWRAASGPLVNDERIKARLSVLIPPRTAARLSGNETLQTVAGLTADELLWPISQNLFADRWREELVRIAADGERTAVVLAPVTELGRIPWAALPITDPALGPVRHLIDAADIAIGLPASLGAEPKTPASTSGDTTPSPTLTAGPATDRPASAYTGVMVADAVGDLRWAARLRREGYIVLGSSGSAPATREHLVAELGNRPSVLVINGHVSPGTETEPASAALVLTKEDRSFDRLTVAEIGRLGVPPLCVILGCDGAGAATGTEWTGLAIGLVWAGARQVVTTSCPVIDDDINLTLDDELLAAMEGQHGARGLWAWQRMMARRYSADPGAPGYAPYRWASTVVLGVAW